MNLTQPLHDQQVSGWLAAEAEDASHLRSLGIHLEAYNHNRGCYLVTMPLSTLTNNLQPFWGIRYVWLLS